MFEIYDRLMAFAIALVDTGKFFYVCAGVFVAFVATVYLVKLVLLPFYVAEICKMMRK